MKLAEALLERKAIKERIAALKERAVNDARVLKAIPDGSR